MIPQRFLGNPQRFQRFRICEIPHNDPLPAYPEERRNTQKHEIKEGLAGNKRTTDDTDGTDKKVSRQESRSTATRPCPRYRCHPCHGWLKTNLVAAGMGFS